MELTERQKEYVPMSETAYYILLSLIEPRHGYGVMQHVQMITKDRLHLGPGTLYGSLSRMQQDGLIEAVAEEERRKIYAITPVGRAVLQMEINRLHELYTNGTQHLEVVRP